jgi:CRP/FNR family transcriptional regulator
LRRVRCEACPRRGCSIAADLDPPALREFGAIGTAALYRPRQIVFSEGGPVAGLHLVCQGQVKLFCSDRFGREHVLSLAGPGAVLGEMPRAADATYTSSAEATVESQLCLLPRERLAPFLARHPSVAWRLVTALGGELAGARRKLRDLALKNAESRLAGWLVELAHATGGLAQRRVEISFSRREIAEMIGISTETAIRLLGRLRDRGVIEIELHAFVVRDPDRLLRIAQRDDWECSAPPTTREGTPSRRGSGRATR